jgi:hypothetical protein
MLIKRVSTAIVSAVPGEKIYSGKTGKSRVYIHDADSKNDPEKHFHRPMSKPAVEKQTLIKETKKQKGYRP